MTPAARRIVTRAVVADQAEARFYDRVGRGAFHPTGRLSHPESRLHERDLKSDRPGRLFGVAGRRHATSAHTTPGEHEADVFAHEICTALHREHADGKFDRLVLVAGPSFLGKLRGILPKTLREAVVEEFPKDLVHEPEDELRMRLPRMVDR